MKAFRFLVVFSAVALGGLAPAGALAAAAQPATTLDLSQGLGLQRVAMVIGNTPAESSKSLASVQRPGPAATTEPDAADGSDLESSLVLTLAGVLALLLVSRRRAAR